MDNGNNQQECSLCGKGKDTWGSEGIASGSMTFCGEQCARTAGKLDKRAPDRAITEIEKADAYDANDMQPPFDEAPVKAGGSVVRD